MDYDYHTCFGMPGPNFDYPRQMRYRPNPCPTELTLEVCDDPPLQRKDFCDYVNYVFKKGRHDGYCPVLVLHDICYLASGEKLGDVRANCSIFVYTGYANNLRSHKHLVTNVLNKDDEMAAERL